MSKIKWKPILEGDREDGTHAMFATTINGSVYWICNCSEDGDDWSIEKESSFPSRSSIVLKNHLKSFRDAKRYFSRYVI